MNELDRLAAQRAAQARQANSARVRAESEALRSSALGEINRLAGQVRYLIPAYLDRKLRTGSPGLAQVTVWTEYKGLFGKRRTNTTIRGAFFLGTWGAGRSIGYDMVEFTDWYLLSTGDFFKSSHQLFDPRGGVTGSPGTHGYAFTLDKWISGLIDSAMKDPIDPKNLSDSMLNLAKVAAKLSE